MLTYKLLLEQYLLEVMLRGCLVIALMGQNSSNIFKGKKSSFFLNIILERKLAAALGEKLKNMFKIKK